MARFDLIVRQVGKEPVVVTLNQVIVVGRSRRADLTIDDEELGREQFRIGVQGNAVFLESIGQTNQTSVDGVVLAPGTRRNVAVGATIRVGRTSFTVRASDSTEASGRPGPSAGMPAPEMTMVAPGPKSPPQPARDPAPAAPDLAAQDQTGGAAFPDRTMQAPRPGAPMAGGGRPTGSQLPPTPAHDQTSAGGALDQTMPLKGGPGYRPGAAARPPEPAPAPAPVPAPRAQRPSPQKPAPAKPEPPPPEPPKASPPAQKPPAPPPAAKTPARPTTVAVKPADIQAEIGSLEPRADAGVDVEARLHEALPRLFVKCEGLKRRVRLMKARNMLGRAESTDILLPNESVSEQHAEITFDGTKWMLRDRGSTNGSFVDGAQLRGGSQEIRRHSLIGLGIVRAIFLCNDRRHTAADRRLEERAVKLLVQAGRLAADAGRDAIRLARADTTQSIAELLLMDTPLVPAEWATAIATARSQRGMLDGLRQLLARLLPSGRRSTTTR